MIYLQFMAIWHVVPVETLCHIMTRVCWVESSWCSGVIVFVIVIVSVSVTVTMVHAEAKFHNRIGSPWFLIPICGERWVSYANAKYRASVDLSDEEKLIKNRSTMASKLSNFVVRSFDYRFWSQYVQKHWFPMRIPNFRAGCIEGRRESKQRNIEQSADDELYFSLRRSLR